jgi:hypothetical protein
MSKRWIMVYDDGRTPAIHTTEVEAEAMADALAASGYRRTMFGRVRCRAISQPLKL